MCSCVFWERNMVRKERKNAQKCPNSSQKPTFWVLVQSRVSGAIYSTWHTFLGMMHLQGAPGWCHCDISKFVLLHFLVLTSDTHLEVFSNSDWEDPSVLGNLWMSSFKKDKEIKIPTVGSKVMTLRSVLMCFSQFSQYLNWINFDFNPWIVVRIRIWLSLQWHWSQPVLKAGSKLGFLGPARSQL